VEQIQELAPEPRHSGPAHGRKAKKTSKRKFIALGIGLGIVVIGAYVVNAIHPLSGQGSPVVITVTSGEASGSVYAKLETASVLEDANLFKVYSMVAGAPTIQPGQYQVHQHSPMSTIKSVLSGGPNVAVVSIPVGFTLQETAQRTAGEVLNLFGAKFGSDFTAAVTDGSVKSPFQPPGISTLEGLVAAGDYNVVPGETPRQLLQAMVDRYTEMAAQAGLTPTTSIEGRTAYEIAIIASIVEKEGYFEKNMPNVARVIYNRLARSMPLQMDATILYGLGRDGGAVTPAMLHLNNPYNSYLNHGLTPTAISTSGPAAIGAAVHPPQGTWLYFTLVSHDGTEAFATTFDEQLANERIAAENGIG
jgi:UPF0755 protein